MMLVRKGSVYSVNSGAGVIGSWNRENDFCPDFARAVVDGFDNASLPRLWLKDYLENGKSNSFKPDDEITYQTPTLDGRLLHFDGSECKDPYVPYDAWDALVDLLDLLV